MRTILAASLVVVALITGVAGVGAQTIDDAKLDQTILDLQHRWAVIQYQTPENQREDAFATLAKDAHAASLAFPGKAEPLVWEGIILSSYAGAKGGFGALSLVKEAKAVLEKASAINADAMRGSIYTTLGTLYFKVPGWPIGFGNDTKAKENFKKALALNPDGLDPNYFHGDYLLDQGDFTGAVKAFEKAIASPDRPKRPLADKGRRAAAREKLAEARSHI